MSILLTTIPAGEKKCFENDGPFKRNSLCQQKKEEETKKETEDTGDNPDSTLAGAFNAQMEFKNRSSLFLSVGDSLSSPISRIGSCVGILY